MARVCEAYTSAQENTEEDDTDRKKKDLIRKKRGEREERGEEVKRPHTANQIL